VSSCCCGLFCFEVCGKSRGTAEEEPGKSAPAMLEHHCQIRQRVAPAVLFCDVCWILLLFVRNLGSARGSRGHRSGDEVIDWMASFAPASHWDETSVPVPSSLLLAGKRARRVLMDPCCMACRGRYTASNTECPVNLVLFSATPRGGNSGCWWARGSRRVWPGVASERRTEDLFCFVKERAGENEAGRGVSPGGSVRCGALTLAPVSVNRGRATSKGRGAQHTPPRPPHVSSPRTPLASSRSHRLALAGPVVVACQEE